AVAPGSDAGDRTLQHVLNADATRALQRDRHVPRANADAHRLADQRVDVGRGERPAVERERRDVLLHVLLDDRRVYHRAAFERAFTGPQVWAAHHVLGWPDGEHTAGRHEHHGVGDAYHLLDRVAHVDDRHLHLVTDQLDVLQHLLLAVRVERG